MRNRRDNLSLGDAHISDAMLLLALSGELSTQESDQVRDHLEVCWTCRVRSEKFEQTIQEVVDYRDEIVKPHVPLPSGPRAMFIARLEEAARQAERKTGWQRMRDFVLLPTHSELFRGFALAGLCIVIVIAVAGRFRAPVVAPVKASADDILASAVLAEKSKLATIVHPVVYREISVRYSGHVARESVYRDSVSNKIVDIGIAAAPTQHEVDTRLEGAHFDSHDPLSVTAFIAWRNNLDRKRDDIVHSSDGLTTVRTTAGTGRLRQVALTLRDSDFHPVTESFRFEDEKAVEVAEVNYDILPFAKVQPGVFTPLPESRPALVAHVPVGPSIRDLLDSEVKARVILHVLGADLGEQIEVSQDEDKREVVVSGLVETASRKQELSQALQVVPYAELQLTSVEDADELAPNEPSTNHVVIANSFGTPLDSKLNSLFPDPSVRAEFVNSAFNQARKALNTAWALRRLSDRYSSDVTSRLGPDAERELEVLIRAQVEALQSQLSGLGKSLAPVLGPINPNGSGDATDASDWHWLVDRGFSSTERIHSDVAVLLSGSSGDNVDRDAIVSDLRGQLERMSIQLPEFSQRVSGRFLSPSQLNADVR